MVGRVGMADRRRDRERRRRRIPAVGNGGRRRIPRRAAVNADVTVQGRPGVETLEIKWIS